MQSAPVNLRAYGRLLRDNRNFRLLWSAQVISEVGDWLYSVAIYSLLLQLTGSAQAVALAFVLQVLPQTFTAPTAGVLNDRVSRRKLMMAADWARAGITFLMLFAQSRETIWLLYLLLLLETVFWGLFEPARNAVIPNITADSQEMLVANSLSATTWAFTLATGSAIGGLLAAVFGRNTVFVINAASFVVSALLIRRMKFHEPHTAGLPPMKIVELLDFSPILDGVRYVKRDGRLFATMMVKTGISFMGTNWVLLPVFGERIFPVSIAGFDPRSSGMLGMAVLMGSRGVGALLGPLLAGRWAGPNPTRFRLGILGGFLLGATGYSILSTALSLPLACLAVVVAHSGGSIAWVFSTTLLQIRTDDRYRGRVFSAEAAFSMLTLSILTYSAGALIDKGWSVRTLALVTAGMLTIPAVSWALAQRLWAKEL
jgi:MFS family permease